MKLIYIILLSLAIPVLSLSQENNRTSSTNCNATEGPFLVSDLKGSGGDRIVYEEKAVPFLANYDLKKDGYQIILEIKEEGTSQIYLIQPKKAMLSIAKKYNHSRSVPYEDGDYNSNLVLMKKDKVLEIFNVDWNKGKLSTNCGTIKIDNRRIQELGEACVIEKIQEESISKDELIKKIRKERKDKFVYGFLKEEYRGEIEFKYYDAKDKVGIYFSDPFWKEIVEENLKRAYNKETYNQKIQEIGITGLILQHEILEEANWKNSHLISWKKIEDASPIYKVKFHCDEKEWNIRGLDVLSNDVQVICTGKVILRKG